ncbi:MAG: DUF2513 domain-containing protein [Cyanobacteria bacterium P01_D01_bin.105]
MPIQEEMKRDLDLLRKILLEIESWSDASQARRVDIEGYSQGAINYHAYLLYEAKYIEASVLKSQAGDTIVPIHLTGSGHEFLDEARDTTIWGKAKMVAEKAGASSLAVFRPILVKVAASEAERALNAWIG